MVHGTHLRVYKSTQPAKKRQWVCVFWASWYHWLPTKFGSYHLISWTISSTLLSNNLQETQQLKTTHNLLKPRLCASGVQAWLCWALCFRVSSESCNQGISRGRSLTSRFDWGRIPFQAHVTVDSIHFFQVVGLRTSVSCWLPSVPCHVASS